MRTGRVYALGAPIGRDGVPVFGFRPGPQRTTLYDDRDAIGDVIGAPAGIGSTEDVVSFPRTTRPTSTRSATHDSGVIYNGHPQSACARSAGPTLRRAGDRRLRGARRARGPGRGARGPLEPGQVVTVADVERALARQGGECGPATPCCCARAGSRACWRTRSPPSRVPSPASALELAGGSATAIRAPSGPTTWRSRRSRCPRARVPHVERLVDRGVHLMENLVLGRSRPTAATSSCSSWRRCG